eukprot:s122_g36.t1
MDGSESGSDTTGLCPPTPRSPRLLRRGLPSSRTRGFFHVRYGGIGRFEEFIRTDLFHYLANMPFRYLVLVYTVTYFLGWVIFTFWWQVAAEGCEPKDLTFRRAFLLSLETMTTIGYGVSDPFFDDCRGVIPLLVVQSLLGLLMDTYFLNLMYTRLSTAVKRASSIIFSDAAVVFEEGGHIKLSLRICEVAKRPVIEPIVRMYAIKHDTLPEPTELIDVDVCPMILETPNIEIADGKLFLMLPTKVVHRVDAASPLAPPDLKDLDDFQYCINSFDYLEILVVVSASCPITGNSLESRHSYSKENLRYKSRLAPCVRVFDGAHEVDFEAFHQTVPLKEVTGDSGVSEKRLLESGESGSVSGVLELPTDALAANMGKLDVDDVSVENIEMLLSRIVGRIDRGRMELEENPGGAPRRYKRWDPRDAGDLSDVEPLELQRWEPLLAACAQSTAMAGRAPLLSCIALFSVALLAPTFTPSLLGFPKAKGAQQRTRAPTQLQADASGLNPFGPVVSYAKALSDAAESKGEDVVATQDMLKIKQLYQSEDFQDSLFIVTNDYNLTAVEQAESLIKLVQPQSSVVPKFIVFLAKKNRLRGLKAICLEYIQSLYHRQSITPVTVRVAQRLTAEQLEKLKEKMREKADTDDVKIHMEVDANLIGGLQVEWGYNDPEALYAPSHGSVLEEDPESAGPRNGRARRCALGLSASRSLRLRGIAAHSPSHWLADPCFRGQSFPSILAARKAAPEAGQRRFVVLPVLVCLVLCASPGRRSRRRLSRFTMESETCLFLAEWEAVRGKAHAVRRKWAEDELCRQQLQIQCGSTSLQSWLSVMETQKKVLEGAAAATAQALSEVESHWRPVRLEATDGGPASWLLSAEQAKVASLKARAAQGTAAVPAGGSDLRKRQQALSDHVQGQVVSAVRGWDQTHAAAEAAWLSHHQRVEETTRAIAQDKAPPDSWLSEVRYREQARKHLSEQAAAEELLLGAASKLHDLEAERALYWQAFVEAYRACSAADVPPPGEQHMMPAPTMPPQLQLPEVPEIPSAGGAVLQRVPAAMVAPGGLFGLGGGGWREGATLVLTIHGYLHLFYTDPKVATAKPEDAGPELVESDIQASVYAPMATKCVFQRRGKELILELAEPEATPPEGSPSSEKPSAAASLRKWWSGKAQEPVPRRILARLSCPDEFKELEGRCHEFVRKGHALRAATPPRVALLRDVSMSMAGVNATWSSRVALGLMEACQQREMSFGYIEFNHCSSKFRGVDGSFFSQDYGSLSDLAMRLQCNGWTNYSKPLSEVLQEFADFSSRGGNRRRGARQLQQQSAAFVSVDPVLAAAALLSVQRCRRAAPTTTRVANAAKDVQVQDIPSRIGALLRPAAQRQLTPLQWACSRNLYEVVEHLTQHFMGDVRPSIDYCLFNVSRRGYTSIAELLIQRFPAEAESSARRDVVEAARSGQAGIVRLLSERFPSAVRAVASEALCEACGAASAQIANQLLRDFPEDGRSATSLGFNGRLNPEP